MTLKPLQDRPSYIDKTSIPTDVPCSPFRPLDCWLVMQKLEQIRESKIYIYEPNYQKDREINCIVLAAGPGYRPLRGMHPRTVELARVPNEIVRGDLVHVLETACIKYTHSDGKTYYLVESHKILFAFDR